ncbi:hypothetical protein GWO43_16305 [candidate division KSB1 bacterium]|nr:hypothetical protein [candidate division KSB1 bacterium]NIT72406.1 hypothetical protein [candidate division KSB1 bacterium]NIW70546.1 hypothetical protein [candidate division KSB1 bacterium]NIX72086.1 hypothetical protein [candidate division KSB1 bacterium]
MAISQIQLTTAHAHSQKCNAYWIAFDIHIEVPAVGYKELVSDKTDETSTAIRERVKRARQIQQQRFTNREYLFCKRAHGVKGHQRILQNR